MATEPRDVVITGRGIRRGLLQVHFERVYRGQLVTMDHAIPIKRMRETPLGRHDAWAALCYVLSGLVSRDMNDARIDAAIEAKTGEVRP